MTMHVPGSVEVAHRLLSWALFILGSLFAHALCAQFTEVTQQLGVEIVMPPNVYGSAISFYDFNYDGWDDLTISSRNGDPYFFINQQGTLTAFPLEITNPQGHEIVGMLWADVDNDGDADLLVTKEFAPVELYINTGNFNFELWQEQSGLPMEIRNYKGAAFADVNHDGNLDVYISAYYHPSEGGSELESRFYYGNGDGTFLEVTNDIGLALPPRPTFQPAFADVNGDGWEDLYLAIDRIEFRNELFINNGDGTFTNSSQDSGADIYICSMTATVGDYNHDQALDIYVTSNPTTGNILLNNTGETTFENMIPAHPLLAVGMPCWGSLWLDFDNDSWDDLFVCTVDNAPTPAGNNFFKNIDGSAFENYSSTLQISNSPSASRVCAMGDIDNDGYNDFAITNRAPFPSRVFHNNGGENHFVGIRLQGTIANRDGIGTWVHCYAGDLHLVNYTLCGENFYGQDANSAVFGLGEVAAIDSIVLEWNSGTHEVYINPEVDNYHHYIEGASFQQPFSVFPEDTVYLCPGQSIVLDGGDFPGYLWNTGQEEQLLSVDTAGTYFVEVLTDFGNTATSYPVVVLQVPEGTVSASMDEPSCYGSSDGSIFLSLDPGILASVMWNTGDSIPFIDDLAAGTYHYAALDAYNCAYSDTLTLLQPDSLWGDLVVSDVLCYGESSGSATITAEGGTPPYFENWSGLNPNTLPAGNYEVELSDLDGCTWATDFSVGQPDSLWILLEVYGPSATGESGSASVSVMGGTPPYAYFWSTGVQDTDSIAGLAPGDYTLEVTDDNGCALLLPFNVPVFTSSPALDLAQLRLFPNPTEHLLNIAGCSSGHWQTEIINSAGQVLDRQLLACPAQVDVQHLAPGLYALRMTNEHQQQRILRFNKRP